jgi:peptidoglycan/xylan/chitin deacetylase (PgdA/CDA1 family)
VSPIAARQKPWAAPPLVTASLGVHVLAAGGALLMPQAAPVALAAVALNHAVLTGVGLWPRSRLLGPNFTALPAAARERKAFALTIDDGPDPRVTPPLLDMLDLHGLKASFFLIAEEARTRPALALEIAQRGHDIQNHSLRHAHHFSLMGPRAIEREVMQAQLVLADITGQTPHCFRAPAGLRNPFLDPVLHRHGLNLVSWTRRGFDTRNGSAKAALARLTRGLGAGDILLLHDGHAGRSSGGRPVVLEVLTPLLERCAALGLHGETLRQAVPQRRGAAAPDL